MNISIDINKIALWNIYFLEKKKNMVMDGNFTKLIYSNDYFVMNGLYIVFPIEIINFEKNMNKTIIKFNPYLNQNINIIHEFAKLEQRIIEQYKNNNNYKFRSSNNLSKQLYSGTMKLYREFNLNEMKTNIRYIMKISGVWETYEEVGITYKLIEVYDDILHI